MGIFLRVHRPLWRWMLSLLLLLSASAVITLGIGSATARPAQAASASDRGPSAAVDDFNNQFVFWKGTDSNLWEAFYDTYTGKWNGPVKVGMGPLGSEPSVVVTNQHFAGQTGNLFGAQYVYWQGEDGGLWFAYWTGTWHGPINLSSGLSELCSQPTATFINPPQGPPSIYVFWKGSGGASCGDGSLQSSDLWYIRNIGDFTNPLDYSGPTDSSGGIPPQEIPSSGHLGSSPSATTLTSSGPCSMALVCQFFIVVGWQGTNGYLWEMLFDVASESVKGDLSSARMTGPVSDTKALTLGSPPSLASPPFSAGPSDEWEAFWRGSDSNHSLWYAFQFETNGTPNVNISPQNLSNSGALGSAPTVADSFVGPLAGEINTYVFWKGTDGKLWEAYFNGNVNVDTWSIIPLGAFSGTLG